MKKNEKLNKWLWKWHFIAGLISLPFVLILSITGVIYLFRADYEAPRQKQIKEVVVAQQSISLEKQWAIANANMPKKPNAMIVSERNNQATQFVSGRFSHKNSLYVNPFTGEVTGAIAAKDGFMYKVRKLHGELLLGKVGTKFVELIASWMVVLILTGIYIWWPARGWKLKGFFIPRIKEGKRTFFRDIHAITGFWISILLLMVLGGGFPWTDVVGENFKWVQKVTNTGYPATWQGRGVVSEGEGKTITLDEMVSIAKAQNLMGEVTVTFPKGPKGVFSVSNSTPELGRQKKIHFNQFTGEQIMEVPWDEVGVLMRGRMWLMAFHQGEFGKWNWFLMIFIGGFLFIMSAAALVSYMIRKRKGNWGVPKVPKDFNVGYGIVILLLLLAIIFPLFGISLLLLWGWEMLSRKRAIR